MQRGKEWQKNNEIKKKERKNNHVERKYTLKNI